MIDLRTNLRNYYFKETGRVPDEELAMYTDWLEMKIVGPPYSPAPEEVFIDDEPFVIMASGFKFPAELMP